MLTRSLRLAVVAAALPIAAAHGAAKAPCKPPLGATSVQVLARCGKPDEVFSARGPVLGLHQEYRYGSTYVGVIDGRVAYVLN